MTIFKSLFKLNLIFLIFLGFFLSSCGIHRPVDAKKIPPNAKDRVEKNIREGRGYTLFSNKSRGGNFDFASSNEMWRASIELLDFTPLSNIDYSGGIIITDWFSDKNTNENEYLKITIKFLSNEIRADGLDVIIHKKVCDVQNKCSTEKIDSSVNNEIKVAILKKAAELRDNAPLVNPNFKMKK